MAARFIPLSVQLFLKGFHMSKKQKTQVNREYEICRCLVTNIQSITGHSTHDIIAFMESVANECLKNNGIEIGENVELDINYINGVLYASVQDYAYYPNTKVYLGVSISKHIIYRWDHAKNDEVYSMFVKYRFYTPNTFKKMSEKEYDNMVVDAMLTDTSLDFDPPNIRKNKTLIQKEKERKEEEERLRKSEIKYNIKILKTYLKELVAYRKARSSTRFKKELKQIDNDIKRTNNNIKHTISDLKKLGDKTHEVLLTPTDSNIT